MQVCLTIGSGLWPVLQTKQSDGFTSPWEVAGFREDFELADNQGGFFDLSHWGVIDILGPDAADYLNRMTTLNFKSLSSDTAAYGAFLTGKAGVVALGMFLPCSQGYHYVVSPGQSGAATEHAEKFHFLEKLTVSDASQQWALFGLWKPSAKTCSALGIDAASEPMKIQTIQTEYGDLQVWRDHRRHSLVWLLSRRDRATDLLRALRSLDVPLLGERLFEYHRIMSGLPRFGLEVSEKDLVLEANLELAVSRNKGCYPGQEVVERIFTYGQVNRKLLPVAIEAVSEFASVPFSILLGEKKIGTVVSMMEDPQSSRKAVGLAYLHRLYWQSTESFQSEDGKTKVALRQV